MKKSILIFSLGVFVGSAVTIAPRLFQKKLPIQRVLVYGDRKPTIDLGDGKYLVFSADTNPSTLKSIELGIRIGQQQAAEKN